MKKTLLLSMAALAISLTGTAQSLNLPGYRTNHKPMRQQQVTLGDQLRKSGLKAPAHREAGVDEPVSNTPEGTLHENMYVNSNSYGLGFGDVYYQIVDGGLGAVVEGTDGNIWVQAPISQGYVWMLGSPWIKCEPAVGDTVVMHTPQVYALDAGDLYYVQRLKPTDDNSFEVDNENTDIRFVWRNDTLTQIDDCLLGLTDETGDWFYMGDYNIQYTVNPDVVTDPTTIPDYAKENMTMVYNNDPEDLTATGSKILDVWDYDGDDQEYEDIAPTYITQLEKNLPNSAITPTSADFDATAYFTSGQYLGVDLAYNTHVYMLTGDMFVDGTEDNPYFNYNLTDKADVVFDGMGGYAYVPYPASLIINAGRGNLYIIDEYVAPKFYDAEIDPAVPADPIFTLDNVTVSTNFDLLTITFPTVDVNGDELNVNDLYYKFYVDGEEYTLTPALWSGLTSDMTEIPYSFEDTNNYDIYLNSTSGRHSIYWYYRDWQTLGVQSIYYGGGETNTSNIVSVSHPTGVSTVDAGKTIASEQYFDLQGRTIAQPAQGLSLRRVTYTDGTTATFKQVK